MKAFLLIVTGLLTFSPAFAGHHHGHGGHCNVCQSIPGPQGERGEKGDSGDSIVGPAGADGASIKGDAGVDGKAGLNGRDGSDADINHITTINVGVEVRWYDAKHYSLNSGYRYDLNHHGHTIDAAILQIKLGKSYESRQMEAMRKELVAYQAGLAALQSAALDAKMNVTAGPEPTKMVIRGGN